jgi:hypothetical protein
MRVLTLLFAAIACVAGGGGARAAAADAYEQLAALAGEWQADLPGFGRLTNSIRVVSNGTAVEETIGTPADNETSLYTRDGQRLLLTHFCALTPHGHIARLATQPLEGTPARLEFNLVATTNLPRPDAAHMRRVLITLADHDHFSEQWTKSENGKDTVFELHFVRR